MKRITALLISLWLLILVLTAHASSSLDILNNIHPANNSKNSKSQILKLAQFTDPIQIPISQQTDEQNLLRVNKQITIYNNFYKTSIQTDEELEADMLNRLQNFSGKLRQCTPGTYQYSIAGPMELLYITTIIKGEEAGLCITETSYQMGIWGTINIKCQFQPQNLQIVADQNPDLAMLMVINDKSGFMDKDEPMSDCKTSVSGSL